MEMTITEKILAHHAGLKEVEPGQLINARVDVAMSNDITAPITIDQFRKAGAKKVFDREKIVLVPDHFTPNKDIKSAQQCKVMREFAREQGISYSRLANGLKLAGVEMDRKMLAELAVTDPEAFAELAALAKAQVAA